MSNSPALPRLSGRPSGLTTSVQRTSTSSSIALTPRSNPESISSSTSDSLESFTHYTHSMTNTGILSLTNELEEAPTLHVDLSFMALTHVPELPLSFSVSESLDLCHNLLTDLTGLSLKRLKTIDLRQNRLAVFPQALLQLSHLEALYLDDNDIPSIPKDCSSLYALEIFHANRNRITKMSSVCGLSRLVELEIADNGLQVIGKSFFPECPGLQRLDVSGNRDLQCLPKLRALGNLKSLIIADTAIRFPLMPSLYKDPVRKFLVELDLSGLELTALPVGIWKLKRIRRLIVARNRLTYISDSIIQLVFLEELDVSENCILALPPSLAQLQHFNSLRCFSNEILFPPNSACSEYGGGMEGIMKYFKAITPGQFQNQAVMNLFLRPEEGVVANKNSDVVFMESVVHALPAQVLQRHVERALQIARSGTKVDRDWTKMRIWMSQILSGDSELRSVSLKECEKMSKLGTGQTLYDANVVSAIAKILQDRETSKSKRNICARTLANIAISADSTPITKDIFKTGGHPMGQNLLRQVRDKHSEYFGILLESSSAGYVAIHEEIDVSEVKIGQVLGKGASASVKTGVWNDKAVAIKAFNPATIDFKEFRTEIALTSVLCHENVVHCLGAATEDPNFWIVYPLYELGSIHDLLHPELSPPALAAAAEGKPIPEELREGPEIPLERRIKMILDLARGVHYLHDLNIIHRDLKSQNLFVGKDYGIVVGDLGISRVVANRMTKGMGTPRYMAPELLEGKSYSEKADVYAVGLLMYEIMSGMLPYAEIQNPWNLSQKILDGVRPDMSALPKGIKALISYCVSTDPAHRPDMEYVVEMLELFIKHDDNPFSPGLVTSMVSKSPSLSPARPRAPSRPFRPNFNQSALPPSEIEDEKTQQSRKERMGRLLKEIRQRKKPQQSPTNVSEPVITSPFAVSTSPSSISPPDRAMSISPASGRSTSSSPGVSPATSPRDRPRIQYARLGSPPLPPQGPDISNASALKRNNTTIARVTNKKLVSVDIRASQLSTLRGKLPAPPCPDPERAVPVLNKSITTGLLPQRPEAPPRPSRRMPSPQPSPRQIVAAPSQGAFHRASPSSPGGSFFPPRSPKRVRPMMSPERARPTLSPERVTTLSRRSTHQSISPRLHDVPEKFPTERDSQLDSLLSPRQFTRSRTLSWFNKATKDIRSPDLSPANVSSQEASDSSSEAISPRSISKPVAIPRTAPHPPAGGSSGSWSSPANSQSDRSSGEGMFLPRSVQRPSPAVSVGSANSQSDRSSGEGSVGSRPIPPPRRFHGNAFKGKP